MMLKQWQSVGRCEQVHAPPDGAMQQKITLHMLAYC
jgi:hypothetical protein